MKIKVNCVVCGKDDFIYPSRLKRYRTCSKQCLSELKKEKDNVICCLCGKKFHVKPFRVKRLSNRYGITCSKKCSNKLKEKMYMGRDNPNCKYDIDDNYFREVDTEEKSYLLGWVASDGTINKTGFSIGIHKRDREILEKLRDIICKDIPITEKTDTIISLTVNSKTISKDLCKLLNILPRKKSYEVNFPELDSNDLKWSFLRGFFDGDGTIHGIDDTHRSPLCGIYTESSIMRKKIIDFCGIPCNESGSSLNWSGNNALDFLSKLYDNSNIYLNRKYELYLDISTWVPSVSYSRYYKNEHCTWAKTRKDAISPSKKHASDSGYDLVLLEKIKTIGNVDFYDTGIKVKPNYGYYFDLVPRSSISKTGYILANSVGIIDRTYLGNIIVALMKMDKSAPDLKLPNRLVQIIPRPILHLQFVEVDNLEDLGETDRGEGGFGSTGK